MAQTLRFEWQRRINVRHINARTDKIGRALLFSRQVVPLRRYCLLRRNAMNFLFSSLKRLYHSISFSIGLIYKNTFLFIRLVLLSTVSVATGIIIMPLLSYFEVGGTVPWYLGHAAFLAGLFAGLGFIPYLIIHILAKQTESEVKRAQAEHKVRANENEYRDFSYLYEKPPVLTRLFQSAKTKLLKHVPEKEDE